MSDNHVEYYYQPYAVRKNRLMIEQHYCFRGDTVIHSMSIETQVNGRVKFHNLGTSYD